MTAAQPYTVKAFDSATGHTWWLVWGPLGKRGEHLDRAKAEEQAARLNWTCPKCNHSAAEHNRGRSCAELAA